MGWTAAPSLLGFAVALLLWLVLGTVPGWLVVTAFDPWRPFLDRVAIAPLVSMLAVFAVGTWVGVVGIAWTPAQGAAVLGVTSVAAGVVVVRRARAAGRPLVPRARPLRTMERLLALGAGIATALWVIAISGSRQGWLVVIPNDDGTTHGIVMTQILLGHTLDPRTLHGDLASAAGDGGFYPLGLHALAATIAPVSGAVSALLVPLTVLSSLWAVLGAVVLARRFTTPVGAGLAGVAAAFLVPRLPYGQVGWGGVPFLVATALIPAAAVALLDARRRRGATVAVLSLASLVAIHTTEALVVLGLAALVTVMHSVPLRFRLRRLGFLAVLALLSLVVVAPLTWGLLHGGAVRPGDPSPDRPLPTALLGAVVRPFLMLSPSVDPTVFMIVVLMSLAVLAVTIVGMVRVWPETVGRAVVLVVLGLTALAVAVALGPVPVLASPWYGNTDRLTAQASALVPLLLGPGLAVVGSRLRVTRAGRAVLVTASSVVAGVMVLQYLSASGVGLSATSPVTPADIEAFHWLAAHTAPGERVLNDPHDGSDWSYLLTGGAVTVLFGGKPGGGFDKYPEWADRLKLRATIADIAPGNATGALARTWDVRYVLVGERTLADGPSDIDVEALVGASGLHEVFRSGDARVYEVIAR